MSLIGTLPRKNTYCGRRGTSPDERHVLVAWVPTKEYGLVPVGREERSGVCAGTVLTEAESGGGGWRDCG